VSDLVEVAESEQVARRFRSGGTLTEIESAEHPQRVDPDISAGDETVAGGTQ